MAERRARRRAKLGGILAERSGSAVVVGIGINVCQRGPTCPGGGRHVPGAGGRGGDQAPQADGGGPGLRARVLVRLLDALEDRYLAWRDQFSPGDAEASGLREEYLGRCATLGREVTVTLPGGETITGTAAGVDRAGRLEVRTAAGLAAVTAGDVVHLRPVCQAFRATMCTWPMPTSPRANAPC